MTYSFKRLETYIGGLTVIMFCADSSGSSDSVVFMSSRDGIKSFHVTQDVIRSLRALRYID